MSSHSLDQPARRSWPGIVVPVILILLIGWLLFARGMQRDLNHDEHQFLAPGVLLSRDGLLPFRDYPLFHLPNLVFAYAAAAKLTGWPVFSAKLLSIGASIGTVALLLWLVWRHREISMAVRFLLAVAAAALLIFDPVFLFTAGKTWNHEVPAFLLAAALVLQAHRFSNPSLLIAASCGLLGGLAAGCRLTFGPMLVPLFIAAWLVPGSRGYRIRHGLAWGAGALVALLPSLWLFVANPEQFLFGNLEFPKLRLSDPTNLRVQKTSLFSSKVRYFAKEIMRSSWPLFLAYFVVGVRAGWVWLRHRRGSAVCGLVLIVLPFALVGSFAPARYQYQHVFGIIALLAVAVAAGLGSFAASLKPRIQVALAVVMISAAVVAGAMSDKSKDLYAIIPPPPAEWFAFEFHERTQKLRASVKEGPVLTLAPAWPIEAGLSIYPEFATGEFAWRSAHLIPKERRAALKLIAPDDLDALLAARPPAAIMTGFEEPKTEEPFVDYATRQNYRAIPLEKGRKLWLPPHSEKE